MAQTALRLRRALSLSTAILSHTRLTTTPTVTSLLQTTPPSPAATSAVTHHRHFHSTPSLSLSSGLRSFNDTDKIDPDSILFEGCDYNHWLIVMDFGKNPSERPPPDQMVETYVQTAAQVLGSVEVAKKRIYACSTTTYTGFQVEVDEDTSKKFEALPGVIFVLPDSYIDPVKKEYGGDKYINGEIIPRPPPVQQFGRTRRGVRPDDTRPRVPMHNQQGNPPYNHQGNPAYNQQGGPAYNQQGGPAYKQQGGPAYNQHGSMPGDGRGYRPQGPQHGFSPQQTFPSQHTGNSMPSGTPHPGVGMDGYQGGGQSNFVPSQQGNYRQDYNRPQSPMSNRAEGHGFYAQPGSFRSDSGEYGYNHPQGQRGNFPGHHGGQPAPGQMGISGDNRNHSPSTGTGDYGQRGAASFEQSGATQYRQGPTGSYNQGAGTVYAPHGENQRFPQTSNEPSSPMEHRNYPPGHKQDLIKEDINSIAPPRPFAL